MREQNTDAENEPFVTRDRRRTPDRRTTWRGGRRDTDWTDNRPVSFATLRGLSPVGWWWGRLFSRQSAQPTVDSH